jgi:hypothetical protein
MGNPALRAVMNTSMPEASIEGLAEYGCRHFFKPHVLHKRQGPHPNAKAL